MLLVRRGDGLAVHGGSWVFPGGGLEPIDHARRAGGRVEDAARRAAAREVFEEVGLTVDPGSLVPLSVWMSPEGYLPRFHTHFFVAPAPTAEVAIDGVETVEHRWCTPSEAVRAAERSAMTMPAPVIVSLLQMRGGGAAEVCSRVASAPVGVFEPKPVEVPGGFVSLYGGDVAYDDVNRFHDDGLRHRLWMVDEGIRYERTATDAGGLDGGHDG